MFEETQRALYSIGFVVEKLRRNMGGAESDRKKEIIHAIVEGVIVYRDHYEIKYVFDTTGVQATGSRMAAREFSRTS